MSSSTARLLLLLSVFFAFFATRTVHGQNETESLIDRNKRMFSIFSVVTFANTICTLKTSGMQGTCLSSSTCSSQGGTVDGSCASGFGVCCMLSVSSCGSTVSHNLTYIQSPGYPSTYTTTGTCTYTINADPSICEIRFDFTAVVTNQPNTTFGICNTDKVQVASSAESVIPLLCGTLSGSHMYVETGHVSNNAATITFTTGTLNASVNRVWKVLVQYIPCFSRARPPTDCMQYFTGSSGFFSSYNYPYQALSNQSYNYCFRQEEGYCSIAFSQNGPTAFNLLPGSCTAQNIMIKTIPVTNAPANQIFCGTTLNSQNIPGAQYGDIYSNDLPFMVGFHSVFSNATITGFNLAYMQIPC